MSKTIREQVYDLVSGQARAACIYQHTRNIHTLYAMPDGDVTGRNTSPQTLGMCWPDQQDRLLVSTRPETGPRAVNAMRAWLATILRSGREMAPTIWCTS